MKQPPGTRQNISSNTTKIILVIIFLAVLLLAFGLLVGLILRQGGFQLPTPPTQTQPIPTMFFPTPDCGSPTLLLDSNTFEIETIQPAADGSLSVPSDTSGIAYWVEGTDTNYTFVLSPSPQNLAIMQTITVGTPAKATWMNCNSTTYSLSVPQQASFSVSALPDQSTEGITIFFQADSTGAGFMVTGELTEEEISTFNTPAPSEIQAEIALLETTTSPDRTTIQVGISIYNYGQSAFTLATGDVSLTQPDGTPLNMTSSEPALPKEIAPAATETFHFTFPRPASQTATIKILEIEYELGGY